VVSIFGAAGMTRTQAVMIFLPISVVAVLARFASGWLSDRVALQWLLATAVLLAAAARTRRPTQARL
jgi:nitrate/nitrite transporter NarK